MTKKQVSQLVAVIMAAWPANKVSEATTSIYETMLSDLDDGVATQAVARLMATAKFLPTIAEIRAAAALVQTGHARAGLEAWGDVLREVSRTGAYRIPCFEDRLVGVCVSSLGWRNICLSENQAAERARFIEMYDRMAERYRVESTMPSHLRLTDAGVRGSSSIAEAVASVVRELKP